MTLTPLIDATNEVTNPAGFAHDNANNILGVAIHHSVTWYNRNMAGASEADERAHIHEIDGLHVREGYGGFGYHLAAFPSGRLYQCTSDLLAQRAHVAGRNHELLGIVAIGRFDEGYGYPPPDAQLAAIASGVRYLQDAVFRERTAGGTFEVQGHNSWALPGNGTACAGLLNNISDWLPRAEAMVQDEPAPIPPGPGPVFLPVDLSGPNGTMIRLEAYGIRFFVAGVNVLNIGSFTQEGAPGQIAKLFGNDYRWLVNSAGVGAADWSAQPGD